MSVENFPPHIQNLLIHMREKEEIDRLAKERENDMFKLKICCHHPVKKHLEEIKLFVSIDTFLYEAASDAYEKFKLQDVVKLKDCRLVSYNKVLDSIDCSFDGDQIQFSDISTSINILQTEWLLEIKQPGMLTINCLINLLSFV